MKITVSINTAYIMVNDDKFGRRKHWLQRQTRLNDDEMKMARTADYKKIGQFLI